MPGVRPVINLFIEQLAGKLPYKIKSKRVCVNSRLARLEPEYKDVASPQTTICNDITGSGVLLDVECCMR